MELAVFRFTLGIPGLPDALIPRVVGVLGGALLLGNNILANNPSPAQGRAEALGFLLAVACIAVPSLDARLLEAKRGVTADEALVAGSAQVFALKENLDESARQELAWATFVLLRNSNARGALIVKGGRVWCVRGCLRVAAVGDEKAVLAELDQSVASASSASRQLAALQSNQPQPFYLEDEKQLLEAGASTWGFVPPGVKAILALPLAGGADNAGMLLLMGSRPRAFSQGERRWAAELANKLNVI